MSRQHQNLIGFSGRGRRRGPSRSRCLELSGSSPRAFTLIELLVTITIIALLTAIIVPTLSDDSRLRLMAASAIITSDLELAQVMNISRPDEPVVVRFLPGKRTYWLAHPDKPDTPITPPGAITFGKNRAATAVGVGIALTNVTNNTIEYNAQGGLKDFTGNPVITLDLDGRSVDIEISATTGTVSETVGP